MSGASVQDALTKPITPDEWMSLVWTLNGINSRGRQACLDCIVNHRVGDQGIIESLSLGAQLGTFICDCTLKKGFLDRWLCMPCYWTEAEKESDPELQDSGACGAHFHSIISGNCMFLYGWCGGGMYCTLAQLRQRHC